MPILGVPALPTPDSESDVLIAIDAGAGPTFVSATPIAADTEGAWMTNDDGDLLVEG